MLPLNEEALQQVRQFTKLLRREVAAMTPDEMRTAATLVEVLESLPSAPKESVSVSFRKGARWIDFYADETELVLSLGQAEDGPNGPDFAEVPVFEAAAESGHASGDLARWMEAAESILPRARMIVG